MANVFIQYLKETRAELRHVAWPTRMQTTVYTVMVALISIGIALYLGLFDFLFTSGLSRALEFVPSSQPVTITQQAATSTVVATSSDTSAPNFGIPTK